MYIRAVIRSYRICSYKNVTKTFELDLFTDYLDTIIYLLILYVLCFKLAEWGSAGVP